MTFFKWLFVSSANPSKMSLTIRGALFALIPWILNALAFACGFKICLGLQQTDLELIFGTIADIAFWFFSIVAGIQMVYGFIRKIYRTLTGKNHAIQ